MYYNGLKNKETKYCCKWQHVTFMTPQKLGIILMRAIPLCYIT